MHLSDDDFPEMGVVLAFALIVVFVVSCVSC